MKHKMAAWNKGGGAARWALFLQLVLLATVIVVAAYYYLEDPPIDDAYRLVRVLFILTTAGSLSLLLLAGYDLLSFAFLFLLAASLFNGGLIILDALGQSDESVMLMRRFALHEHYALEAALLVSVCIAFFALGALCVRRGRPRAAGRRPVYGSVDERSAKAARITGWILIALGLVPLTIVITSRATVAAEEGYFSLYEASGPTGLGAWMRVLSLFALPGLMFIIVGARSGCLALSAIGVVLLISLGHFTIGSRSGAVMPLLATAWLWDRSVRRVPRWPLVALGLVMLVVIFPYVKQTRNLEHIDAARIAGDHSNKILMGSVSEMGASMVTVAGTMKLVPDERNYEYGAGYFYSLLTIAPNFFWELHPSAARGSYGRWLTWELAPGTAASGGGLGYSFIAEAYANFGWPGAPLVAFILGLGFARLESWAQESGRLERAAVLASLMCFIFFFARGETISQVRPLVWYALAPYVAFLWVRGFLPIADEATAAKPERPPRGRRGLPS